MLTLGNKLTYMSNEILRMLVLASIFATSVCAPTGARSLVSDITAPELNMSATNKAVVTTAFIGWMGGHNESLQSLLSDDIEWNISGNSAAAGKTKGKPELMRRVLGPFGARFSTSKNPFRRRELNGVFADGDVVVVHFSGAGTTNDGTRYENDYVWLLTMRNGKAVKGTAFFDSIAFNELWRVKPADLHQN